MPTITLRLATISLLIALSALCLAAPAPAATPLDLGPALRAPRMTTAESGAGHFTWATPGSEAVHYCRIDPGQPNACAAAKTLTMPGGYGANDGGNAPLLSGSNVLILAGRTLAGDDNKLLFSSADNFTTPTVVATASGAEFGFFTDAAIAPAGTVNAKARILTVQSGPISPSGGRFQATATASGETATQSFALGNGDDTRSEAVDYLGTNVFAAFVNWESGPQENRVFIRRYQGNGALSNINTAGGWMAPAPFGKAGNDVVLAGGPSGLYMAYDRFDDGALVIRRFEGTTMSPELVVAPAVADGRFAMSQDAAGILHFSWVDGSGLRYAYARDTSNSTFTNPQTLASGGTYVEQRIDVNGAGNGWISWQDVSSGHAMVLPLAPGEPQPPSGGGGGGGVYKGPSKKQEKAIAPGLSGVLSTPKGCVTGGLAFKVRLGVKRKGSQTHKLGYTVKKVRFLRASKLIATDRKKPFEATFPTAGAAAGTKIPVRAKVTVKLRRDGRSSTVAKTLRATVKVCP